MTDDRIARLERLLYGAEATAEEREEAARELLELQAAAVSERDDAAADAAGTSAETSVADADGTEPDGALDTDRGGGGAAADQRRRVRRVLIAATAALVVGVLAGWQLGAREAEQQAELAAAADSVFPGPRTQADYLAALPVAADSPATEVFARPATAADVPGVPWMHDFGEGEAEVRLLATRGDDTSIYAVHDGGEYCLFILLPGLQAGTMGCTEGGRFPLEGVNGGMSIEGSPDAYIDVTWRPDGSLSVLVPGVDQETLRG